MALLEDSMTSLKTLYCMTLHHFLPVGLIMLKGILLCCCLSSSRRGALMPSYMIKLTEMDEPITNIQDIQFLHGYYEPTLLILYEPLRTWPGWDMCDWFRLVESGWERLMLVETNCEICDWLQLDQVQTRLNLYPQTLWATMNMTRIFFGLG